MREECAFGGVGGEGERAFVRVPRFLVAAESAEQIGARRMEQVVRLEVERVPVRVVRGLPSLLEFVRRWEHVIEHERWSRDTETI